MLLASMPQPHVLYTCISVFLIPTHYTHMSHTHVIPMCHIKVQHTHMSHTNMSYQHVTNPHAIYHMSPICQNSHVTCQNGKATIQPYVTLMSHTYVIHPYVTNPHVTYPYITYKCHIPICHTQAHQMPHILLWHTHIPTYQ